MSDLISKEELMSLPKVIIRDHFGGVGQICIDMRDIDSLPLVDVPDNNVGRSIDFEHGENDIVQKLLDVLDGSVSISVQAYEDLLVKAYKAEGKDYPIQYPKNDGEMDERKVIDILAALWRSKEVEYSDKEVRDALDIAMKAVAICEIWNGYHGRVVAPKGTMEKINKYEVHEDGGES